MARKVFYSFHYKLDHWRVSQVRNMGIVEGQPILSDHDWEAVEKGGDTAIQKWIDEEMKGKSCVVVLVGKQTANRKWVNYEIMKAWNDKKGVLGIYIHNLKNSDGYQATQGTNPFDFINRGETKLSSIVKCYNPPYTDSKDVYDYIKNNIDAWVEAAIKIREDA